MSRLNILSKAFWVEQGLLMGPARDFPNVWFLATSESLFFSPSVHRETALVQDYTALHQSSPTFKKQLEKCKKN